MDRFPDGVHVRLRSRVRGAYLCADEDGSGVSLTTRRATLNAVWQVHRTEDGDTTHLLFCSAAYGRYLALSPYQTPKGNLHGHRGRDAVQSDSRHPEQFNIRWTVVTAKDGSGDVLLCNKLNGCYLRANTRYGRSKTCDDCVTIGGGHITMMYWTIKYVRRRQAPPPPPLPTPSVSTDEVGLQRKVMFVQAYDDGNFSRSGWRTILFSGRSVYNLMLEIRKNEKIPLLITLCVRAGPYGRLTPLVMDLPRNQDTMHIIVLTRGSPACCALVYPDVPPPPRPLMELFTEEGFLRIKSGGSYLLADQNGVSVRMRRDGGAMSAQQVWVVQLVKNDDPTIVLLRGAAYGRYLATESEGEEPRTLIQCAFEDTDQENLLWRVKALETTSEILLRSGEFTISCSVEKIPSSPIPPNVVPVEPPAETTQQRRTRMPVDRERTIWYMVEGNWKICVFKGQSLSDLRTQLAGNNSVLCIRAGPWGRWTPLFVNLPSNEDTLDILVLDGECRAAASLVYPRLPGA